VIRFPKNVMVLILAMGVVFWGDRALFAQDCNGNGVLDACDIDCGEPGGPCDVEGCGQSSDCNGNGIPDDCEPDIYVDVDVVGAGDGSSWDDAYACLQDALSQAACVEGVEDIRIWVAQGTYAPDCGDETPGDRGATFQLLSDVAIYGGLAGYGEPDPDERDIDLHVTTLSGDITGADNSYHVVTGSDTDATAVLDGFTITGGNADGSSTDRYGGGMYNSGGSPTVANCTFNANHADYGGGMSNGGGSPTVTRCTFTGNTAQYNGAGMYNSSSDAALTDCLFDGNIANTSGGGIYNRYAGNTYTNCTFVGNSANNGGAVYCYHYTTAAVTNCLFTGNTASAFGGAMYVQSLYSSPEVINCTFSDNSTTGYGGGIYTLGTPTVTNCILYGNSDGGGTDESAQLHDAAAADISYSCIQDCTVFCGDPNDYNIGDDPAFVGGGDYHLGAASPSIDAGDNTAVPVGIETDLDGNPRIIDGDGDETATVDMGVYEFNAFSCGCMGDLDGNGAANALDVQGFVDCALGSGENCGCGDFDGDSGVDADDVSGFIAALLSGGPCG
jgi:predicted outer membrane repeat protein